MSMLRLGRVAGPAIGCLAMFVVSSARAQQNLDAGKTAAQLYASDCVMCHRSPQSVARAKGDFSLESFLRVHYTASRESAAKLAAYLRGIEAPPADPARRRATAHGRQAKPSGPMPIKSKGDELIPPANIPQPKQSEPDRR